MRLNQVSLWERRSERRGEVGREREREKRGEGEKGGKPKGLNEEGGVSDKLILI